MTNPRRALRRRLALELAHAPEVLLPDAQPVGLMIAPFAVEAHWSNYLPFKFLLSILFPLAVAALTWKSLPTDATNASRTAAKRVG